MMQDPVNRVLTFDVDADFRPQCPAGAESVWHHASNQAPGKPVLWIVYGPDRLHYAYLWEYEPGTYCVQADADVMDLLDPGGDGTTLQGHCAKPNGRWRWGSIDGEEDDPDNPGQKRPVTDRVVDIGIGYKPPTPTPSNPVAIDATSGLFATAFRPCVPGSEAGAPVDLRLQSEGRLPQKGKIS